MGRIVLFLLGALGAGCGSSSSDDMNAPADLSATADLAGCTALPAYCSARSNCPASAGAAEGGYCAADGGVSTQPGVSVATADCTGYVRVAVSFAEINSSYDYYYDASTGALVAVLLTANQGMPSCLGGPTNFTPPTCQPLVTLCD